MTKPGSQHELPLFLCYRQVDGTDVARWLYRKLHDRILDQDGGDVRLHVYFDQAAPASGNWTAIHKPSLERARALILICSPGVRTRTSDDDWVHMELDWWMSNRNSAPIIVDSTGEGDRWVPQSVREKWPAPQRLLLTQEIISQDPDAANRILAQIINGIRFSESATMFADIIEQKKLLRRFKSIAYSTATIGIIAVFGLLLVWQLSSEVTRSKQDLEHAVDRATRAMNSAEDALRAINGLDAKVQQDFVAMKKDQLRSLEISINGTRGEILYQELSGDAIETMHAYRQDLIDRAFEVATQLSELSGQKIEPAFQRIRMDRLPTQEKE